VPDDGAQTIGDGDPAGQRPPLGPGYWPALTHIIVIVGTFIIMISILLQYSIEIQTVFKKNC